MNPLPRDKLLGDALWKIFLLRERILIAPWKTCGIPSSFVLVLWKRTLSVCTNHPLMWLERRLLFWCNVRKEARACFNCLDVKLGNMDSLFHYVWSLDNWLACHWFKLPKPMFLSKRHTFCVWSWSDIIAIEKGLPHNFDFDLSVFTKILASSTSRSGNGSLFRAELGL